MKPLPKYPFNWFEFHEWKKGNPQPIPSISQFLTGWLPGYKTVILGNTLVVGDMLEQSI